MHSSPTSSGDAESSAEATQSPSIAAGSYSTTAKLWVGWRKRAVAATSTVHANSTRTSPSATGTVLRSTSTSPRLASTTTPAPMYLRPATPSIWYGMSKSTRTSDGVTRCTCSGPVNAKRTGRGTGGGVGGGGANLRSDHRPVSSLSS